jgi:hypothetical protein
MEKLARALRSITLKAPIGVPSRSQQRGGGVEAKAVGGCDEREIGEAAILLRIGDDQHLRTTHRACG